MGILGTIGEAIKKDFNKPLKGRKRKPGESMFRWDVETGKKRKRKSNKRPSQQVVVESRIQAKPAEPESEAEDDQPAEPKFPLSHNPMPRQELTSSDKVRIMRQQPRISGARYRITPPRPRIGR